MDFPGKTFVVVGAGRVIGEALARPPAGRAAHLTIVDIGQHNSNAVAQALADAGDRLQCNAMRGTRNSWLACLRPSNGDSAR
jgi:NAD(P)-dependent dehydrogenase (short-subunit alcohol dehydrogenase family)